MGPISQFSRKVEYCMATAKKECIMGVIANLHPTKIPHYQCRLWGHKYSQLLHGHGYQIMIFTIAGVL